MVGSFLSAKTGTISVSEKLVETIKCEAIKFISISRLTNKIFRLWEIVMYSLLAKYDKMHIDTFSGSAFRIAETASLIARLRKKTIILTLHGGKLPEFYLKYPNRVNRVLKLAEHLQCPSKYLQEFFKSQNITIQYMPNSIDLARFPYDRSSVIPHTLLWVRAFSDIYNPDLAVMILSELRKKYQDMTLTMIGPDKGLMHHVEILVRELHLENFVKITGPVDNNELFEFYQRHEIFLNTTSYESFGLAVMEAAACGIPIVSANVGEIPYIWNDHENIMIVETMKPKAFSSAIVQLLDSPELYCRISINARHRAEQYDWELIKGKWLQLLTG